MLPRPTFRVVLLAAALAVPPFGNPTAATAADSTPSVTPATAPKAPAAAPAPQVPTRPDDRAGYDPAGRRDPFVSLLARGETRLPVGGRPAGIKGLVIGELSVRGVMRTSGKLLAIVQAPDNKTYTVHSGDALYDG